MKISKSNISTLKFLAVIVAVAIVTACEIPGASTFNLSGTLSEPAAGNGVYAYLKLVTNGGASSSPALYWTRSTPFSSGIATYLVTGISAGTYTGWAFIDVNGDAIDSGSALPDSKDYETQNGQQIVISSNQTLNIKETDWTLVP